MLTITLIALTLIASHLAAFFAGANNARRAFAAKEAAKEIRKAITK